MTRVREEAALLVAQDSLTDDQIAAQAGVTRQALQKWKRHPEFSTRVQEHRDTWAVEVKAKGIADRQNRIDALNDRWQRLHRVIEARADDPGYQLYPGGDTGLIVKTERHMGPVTTVEYAVDTGLLKELREHEKQAAQEVGQWTEKREVSGKDGAPLIFTIAIDRRDDDDRDI